MFYEVTVRKCVEPGIYETVFTQRVQSIRIDQLAIEMNKAWWTTAITEEDKEAA